MLLDESDFQLVVPVLQSFDVGLMLFVGLLRVGQQSRQRVEILVGARHQLKARCLHVGTRYLQLRHRRRLRWLRALELGFTFFEPVHRRHAASRLLNGSHRAVSRRANDACTKASMSRAFS